MTSPKNAWIQLYQARKLDADLVEVRLPGRPPSPIPRKKVGLTLSHGEIAELDAWQERLSALMGRKLSSGETVGILTRLCSARLARLTREGKIESIDQLIDGMIGNEG